MTPDTNAGLLQVITASVTPVVMISAAAVLILGINNKHQAMADRLRSLAAEHRSESTTLERRAHISGQVMLFRRRIALSSMAHRALYIAVCSFIVVMLLIFFGKTDGSLGLFALGIGLILVAVILELCELQLGNRTIELELTDLGQRRGRVGL